MAHHYAHFQGTNANQRTWSWFLRDTLEYIPKVGPNSGTPSSSSVLFCPAGEQLRPVHDPPTHYGINSKMEEMSRDYYTTSATRIGNARIWQMADKTFVKTTSIYRPTSVAMFSDAETSKYAMAIRTADTTELSPWRHNLGANYAFWDLHVEQIKFHKLPVYARWGVGQWSWPWI